MLPSRLAVRRHLWGPGHQRTGENGAPADDFLARRIRAGSESAHPSRLRLAFRGKIEPIEFLRAQDGMQLHLLHRSMARPEGARLSAL